MVRSTVGDSAECGESSPVEGAWVEGTCAAAAGVNATASENVQRTAANRVRMIKQHLTTPESLPIAKTIEIETYARLETQASNLRY